MYELKRLNKKPVIHPTAWVAPGAVVFGDVTLDEEASVWFNCVLRGDVGALKVGKRSNIQDLSLMHGVLDEYDSIVGDDVTVGHCAIVHGCVVEDRCLIGMGAKILSGAVIGEESIIAAGAVILEGQKIPPRSLVVGLPGKVKKTLGAADLEMIRGYGVHYLNYKEAYKALGPEIAELFKTV